MSLKECVRQTGVYDKALRVQVLESLPLRTFTTPDGNDRQSITCAVSDGETVAKVSVYSTAHFHRFEKDTSVVLRSVLLKGRCLLVTKVFITSAVTVTDELREAAHLLLHPPPAPVVTLEQALASAARTATSVRGQVVQLDSMEQFLQSRKVSQTVIARMRDEKIDLDTVLIMSDQELKSYLPAYGDRISLKVYARKVKKSSSATYARKVKKSSPVQQQTQKVFESNLSLAIH